VAALDESEWIAHFNQAYYEGDWSGVALRSVGGLTKMLFSDPSRRDQIVDTELVDRCPRLAAAMRAFHCRLDVVRLLRLGPGASIREHRDIDLGYEIGEVRIHVPITTSPEVTFSLDGSPVDMRAGEAWYLDLSLPHRVDNAGDGARVHLVVDCYLNDWLREMLEG
jgi:aspartyl/asparaginyl beta-hydroxylase (cupin superfamily)